MDSNPHGRQPLQSEDQVSESLGRLQLDELADDDTNPSRPTKSTPPSTRPKVSIPDQDFQQVCRRLERNLQPDDDDDSIRNSLDIVWFKVYNALEEDQNLRSRRADQKEFEENVKKHGKEKFIDLLREMAKNKNWRDLLEHGTSFLVSDFNRSNRTLSPDVFLKPAEPEWSLTPASMNGAQLSYNPRPLR